jgi:hypothetical protein
MKKNSYTRKYYIVATDSVDDLENIFSANFEISAKGLELISKHAFDELNKTLDDCWAGDSIEFMPDNIDFIE